MRATSSQRLNLRPTSRSMPTSSKPHERWRAIEASLDASIRANTAWKPDCRRPRRAARSAAACRCPGRCGRGGRRPSPRRWCGTRRAPCTATASRSRRRSPISSVGSTRDDRRERPAAGGDPLLLILERARHEVERGSRVGAPRGCRSCGSASASPGDASRSVIDCVLASSTGADGSCGNAGNPVVDGTRRRRYASRLACGYDRAPAIALLAQSVEQRHGKA